MLLISTVTINAMRTRAVYALFFQRSFDTGITGGGSGLLLPVVASSLSFSFHLSHDRSMTDRKVLRRSYLQVFLIIDQPLLTRYRFPIKSILVTSNTSRFTLLVTFEAIGKNN